MTSIKDDRGYNQGFTLVKSTEARMRRRADLLLSEIKDSTEKRILEIGCGTGEIAFWMAEKSQAKVLGTDLCVPFIKDAKTKYQLPNLRYDVLDFNKAEEFSGERFDYIVGNGILHHLYPNLDTAFDNMKKLLTEGGKIIFFEPNYLNPYIFFIFSFPWLRKLAKLEPDEMAFTKGFVVEKLTQRGYGNVTVDYKDFLLPGIPEFLIAPSIAAGDVLEHIPLLRRLSQSIFIRANKA